VSLYLDTSVLVALLVHSDPFTERARVYIAGNPDSLIVSDFAAAEFASVVSRLTRTRRLSIDDATALFGDFDAWRARTAEPAAATAPDIAAATAVLRRLDLNLRTPDAINIAIADRLGAMLATFDERMAAAARALGVQVASA
jgi:predicted nucleic acid-binding protein